VKITKKSLNQTNKIITCKYFITNQLKESNKHKIEPRFKHERMIQI